jgi:hypothetical protein
MSNNFFPLKNGLHQAPPSSFSLHQAVVAKPRKQWQKGKMMGTPQLLVLQYKMTKTPQPRQRHIFGSGNGIRNNKHLQFLNLITGG